MFAESRKEEEKPVRSDWARNVTCKRRTHLPEELDKTRLLNVCKILLSRDRQTDGTAALSHFGRFHDHRCRPDSSSWSVLFWVTQRRAARPRSREHATRCNVQHWVDRKCLGAFCVTCTWFDTHRRGFREFRDRLSAVPTRTERLKRCALRQLEDLPVACLSKKKKGNESVPTLWAVLERHDDLQLAKTKTNKTFQPAKSDQIFV